MATTKDGETKPAPKKRAKPKRAGPGLPEGTQALLWRGQVAAAMGLSTRRLDELIARGDYPPPDGQWQNKRFWLLSTHNAFLARLAKSKGARSARRVQEAD